MGSCGSTRHRLEKHKTSIGLVTGGAKLRKNVQALRQRMQVATQVDCADRMQVVNIIRLCRHHVDRGNISKGHRDGSGFFLGENHCHGREKYRGQRPVVLNASRCQLVQLTRGSQVQVDYYKLDGESKVQLTHYDEDMPICI